MQFQQNRTVLNAKRSPSVIQKCLRSTARPFREWI